MVSTLRIFTFHREFWNATSATEEAFIVEYLRLISKCSAVENREFKHTATVWFNMCILVSLLCCPVWMSCSWRIIDRSERAFVLFIVVSFILIDNMPASEFFISYNIIVVNEPLLNVLFQTTENVFSTFFYFPQLDRKLIPTARHQRNKLNHELLCTVTPRIHDSHKHRATFQSLHTDEKRSWVNFTTNRPGCKAFEWWSTHKFSLCLSLSLTHTLEAWDNCKLQTWSNTQGGLVSVKGLKHTTVYEKLLRWNTDTANSEKTKTL